MKTCLLVGASRDTADGQVINLDLGKVSVIDMQTWKVIKDIKTEGPGFFMRSHENSPYSSVDVFFGLNKDAVHVIDKSTSEIVKTQRPSLGKTAAHVASNKGGSKVIAKYVGYGWRDYCLRRQYLRRRKTPTDVETFWQIQCME